MDLQGSQVNSSLQMDDPQDAMCVFDGTHPVLCASVHASQKRAHHQFEHTIDLLSFLDGLIHEHPSIQLLYLAGPGRFTQLRTTLVTISAYALGKKMPMPLGVDLLSAMIYAAFGQGIHSSNQSAHESSAPLKAHARVLCGTRHQFLSDALLEKGRIVSVKSWHEAAKMPEFSMQVWRDGSKPLDLSQEKIHEGVCRLFEAQSNRFKPSPYLEYLQPAVG